MRALAGEGATFVPVSLDDLTALDPGVSWVDAIDADEPTLSEIGRGLGFSESAVRWLANAGRESRASVVDGVLIFAVTIPTTDATSDQAEDNLTTLVVTSEHRMLTAHAAADGLIDAVAARVAGGTEQAVAEGVLALIDELTERYESVIERLAVDQQAHAAAVLNVASSKQSATEVVADGLRLASDINRVQRRLRRLQDVPGGLHRLVSGQDQSMSRSLRVSDAIEARTQALAGLEADLDDLSHHLELLTDARMNLISSRQNEISKAIGAWGGVFAVNAVITGWYGMNIGGLPGSGSWVTASSVMAVATVALVVLFRRVGWL